MRSLAENHCHWPTDRELLEPRSPRAIGLSAMAFGRYFAPNLWAAEPEAPELELCPGLTFWNLRLAKAALNLKAHEAPPKQIHRLPHQNY